MNMKKKCPGEESYHGDKSGALFRNFGSQYNHGRGRGFVFYKDIQGKLWDAERVYVNGILHNGLESNNNKPFWKYVKSQKRETVGISALKSNVNVITVYQ